MSKREDLVTRVKEVGGRINVRSGLNPMLWLCAIITMPCLAVYGLKEEPIALAIDFCFRARGGGYSWLLFLYAFRQTVLAV